jgi:hypothetical protein
MAKKLKLPKRLAGIKIPKSVRKGPIGQFINSSGGQVLIAEALLFAAGSYAARQTSPDSTVGNFVRHPMDEMKHAGRATMHAAGDLRSHLARRSDAVVYAFDQAMQAFRIALEERRAPETVITTSDVDDQPPESPVQTTGARTDSAESAKKKPASSSAESRTTPH